MKRWCQFVVSVLCVLIMTRAGAQAEAQAPGLPRHLLIVDAHNDTVQQILLEHIDIGIRQVDGGIDPHSSVLSKLNWRFSPASHLPADKR